MHQWPRFIGRTPRNAIISWYQKRNSFLSNLGILCAARRPDGRSASRRWSPEELFHAHGTLAAQQPQKSRELQESGVAEYGKLQSALISLGRRSCLADSA